MNNPYFVHLFYFYSFTGIPFPNSTTVRRANSCPEMKKSAANPPKDNNVKPLDETDEEGNETKIENVANSTEKDKTRKTIFCSATQTENFWPMPYEHLFLGIFPSLENSEVKPSPAPSPAPFNISQDRNFPPSLYDILDKYVI